MVRTHINESSLRQAWVLSLLCTNLTVRLVTVYLLCIALVQKCENRTQSHLVVFGS